MIYGQFLGGNISVCPPTKICLEVYLFVGLAEAWLGSCCNKINSLDELKIKINMTRWARCLIIIHSTVLIMNAP